MCSLIMKLCSNCLNLNLIKIFENLKVLYTLNVLILTEFQFHVSTEVFMCILN